MHEPRALAQVGVTAADAARARFTAFCDRREAQARRATIPGYTTLDVGDVRGLIAYGNAWTRERFDGDFYRTPAPMDLPSVALVFVRSRDGNTVAATPSVLGGGATDLHLIYEGLSRIDADGILSGAATVASPQIVLSLWHPELVALRRARGKPRHPRQIVVTARGSLPFDDGLMFQVPELPVTLITTTSMAPRLRERTMRQPWIDVIDAGEPLVLRTALGELRRRGVEVVSAIGGPRTATALLRERLVSDIYLTTSAIDAGEPNTPYTEHPPAGVRLVVRKAGRAEERGVVFEHLTVDHQPGS